MDIVFDLDELVRISLHLDWRIFHLNREAWLMLVGFHQDLIIFLDIAIAVRGFGKLLAWDKLKGTKAGVTVKVRVDELENIPFSIVQSKIDDFRGESWVIYTYGDSSADHVGWGTSR